MKMMLMKIYDLTNWLINFVLFCEMNGGPGVA